MQGEARQQRPEPPDALSATRRYVQDNGAGVAGSLLLHGLLALALLWLVAKGQTKYTPIRFLPVDIVRLADRTTAPQGTKPSPVPRAHAAGVPIPHSASPVKPRGMAPAKKSPPVDAFEARLKALAQLRQPQMALGPLDNADSDSASNGAAAGDAVYSVKDFIRAQVLRRWSLDLSRLGGRNFDIRLHVEIARDGTVTKSEIVDLRRYKTDAMYRDIAISARNAVLLSSPIAFPDGGLQKPIDVTLTLNPRDTLR